MRYRRSLAIASRHDRLIELIRTGVFSSPDLAQKLKVSEQTIYRDIDFLRQRGYSIRAEKRGNGWRYVLARSSSAAIRALAEGTTGPEITKGHFQRSAKEQE